jgi:hypothetical protein
MPYKRIVEAQELILLNLYEHGPLGTGELSEYTKLDDETVLINCKKLVKQGLIHDKETKKKGKYRLDESAKLPEFLSYRARNRSFAVKILKDIFSSNDNNHNNNNESIIKSFDDFSKNIGIYISYILLESTRPGGPWTVKRLKQTTTTTTDDDYRMKDIDLLRETWLTDTIDPNFLIEQFKKYFIDNSNQNNYQELVEKFESAYPDIYKKIVFHEEIAEVRRLKKKQNKKKKQQQEPEQQERSEEEIYSEVTDFLDKKNIDNNK